MGSAWYTAVARLWILCNRTVQHRLVNIGTSTRGELEESTPLVVKFKGLILEDIWGVASAPVDFDRLAGVVADVPLPDMRNSAPYFCNHPIEHFYETMGNEKREQCGYKVQ